MNKTKWDKLNQSTDALIQTCRTLQQRNEQLTREKQSLLNKNQLAITRIKQLITQLTGSNNSS